MRKRTLAMSLGAVALVVTVAFCYLALGARLRVTVLSETVVPASVYPDEFAAAAEAARLGVLGDRQYAAMDGTDIEDYAFVEIELSASSFGLLPCEWIEGRVTPLEGDIALARCDVPDIPSIGRARATLLVLARADAARTGHGVWVEYYAFGQRAYADAK